MLKEFEMDLQLFAEEPDVEPELEEEVEEELEEEEVTDEESEEDEESEPEETVPLATFLAEKKRRQEAEKDNLELKKKTLKNDVKEKIKSLAEKLVTEGDMSEKQALILAESMVENFKVDGESKIKKTADQELVEELEELATDPYYEDAPQFKDSISRKMKELPGLTAEQAYLLVRKGRYAEVKTDIEQRNLIDRRKSKSKEVKTASSTRKKKKFPLSKNDEKALKGLQESQPNSNWTREKFYKLIKEK